MGTRIMMGDALATTYLEKITEEIVTMKVLPHRKTSAGCQQQYATLCPNITRSGSSPLGIVPEGGPIPFTGISQNAQPESTDACNIGEAYNPVSTKGLLAAVKVNEKVVLSPDGQSVTAPDTLFRRRKYTYYYNGDPVVEVSSFESLSNYNHFIRWYDDHVDGAEGPHGVDCEPESEVQPSNKNFYWVVKSTDVDSSSTSVDGNQLNYNYLVAPIEDVPDVGGNPHPDYYLSFINKKAIITADKLYADKFLIQQAP
ncbi:uncharacterized protein [Dysidea avara]|uniref:uncharacterized protein n=1 Tax=Dysidea avara TaxID=196820 RepID=UPI00332F9D2E